MANISVHDPYYQYSVPNAPVTPWGLGWTSQQLVTSAEETATGGTYE
jgi:hypothetical protein